MRFGGFVAGTVHAEVRGEWVCLGRGLCGSGGSVVLCWKVNGEVTIAWKSGIVEIRQIKRTTLINARVNHYMRNIAFSKHLVSTYQERYLTLSICKP